MAKRSTTRSKPAKAAPAVAIDEPPQIYPMPTPSADASRTWPAAEGGRFSSHWNGVDSVPTPINYAIFNDLPQLRNRCEYEARRNPTITGVIETYIIDMIGEIGPTLQIQTDDAKFNDEAEAYWNNWWANPDLNGELSGVEWLAMCIRLLWTCGEHLTQIVGDPDDQMRPKLLTVHPRRLGALSYWTIDSVMGVRRTPTGKPISYYIQDVNESNMWNLPLTIREIPARDVVHDFRRIEPGQARGIPWLATSLQTIADLYDYDLAVLDAAKMAADFSVVLHKKMEGARDRGVILNETTEIPRRSMFSLPPGYEASQIKAEQPGTSYLEHRSARMAELGRPVGMPLMMIQLDSSAHNYSSARFDGQVYQRGIKAVQGWTARRTLLRLVNLIVRDGVLAGQVKPYAKNYKVEWTWPSMPHVDPAKEQAADHGAMEDGTQLVSQTLAKNGRTLETHFPALVKEIEQYKAAGLMHPLVLAQMKAKNSAPQTPAPDAAEPDQVPNLKLKGAPNAA